MYCIAACSSVSRLERCGPSRRVQPHPPPPSPRVEWPKVYKCGGRRRQRGLSARRRCRPVAAVSEKTVYINLGCLGEFVSTARGGAGRAGHDTLLLLHTRPPGRCEARLTPHPPRTPPAPARVSGVFRNVRIRRARRQPSHDVIRITAEGAAPLHDVTVIDTNVSSIGSSSSRSEATRHLWCNSCTNGARSSF